MTTPSTPLCYGPQVTVWVAKHSDLRSQIVGILEISRFGPAISVCEVVRFSMADTCRSSDWDHRSCRCFFRWRWWSNWIWLWLWCHVKYPSIPVLLVELMAPSKIIRSLFSQLSLELKNVEKDDAHFLSPGLINEHFQWSVNVEFASRRLAKMTFFAVKSHCFELMD